MSGAAPATGRTPLIGITGRRFRLSLLQNADPRYGDRCIDTTMSDFPIRVADAGGLPIQLSYETDPAAVCEWLSAVVITGGQDMHPSLWGGDTSVVRDIDPRTDVNVHDTERDDYELAITRAAIDRGIPVLGVCRGMQVLNVALGGTLVADLPPGPIAHLSPSSAPSDGHPDHRVTFEPGSVAARLYGEAAVTNSWHHQAVDSCGLGLIVTGRAADGVIESIEVPGQPVLGVQWHPEWMVAADPALHWIVDEARRRLSDRSEA